MPPELFPKMVWSAIVAIFASVTLLAPIVAANDPVPVPVTSPVSVIVWSPVFVPERFAPDMFPLATIVVGVIAARVIVMAGVLVAVATEPETPLAVTTDTLVTVPPPPLPGTAAHE